MLDRFAEIIYGSQTTPKEATSYGLIGLGTALLGVLLVTVVELNISGSEVLFGAALIAASVILVFGGFVGMKKRYSEWSLVAGSGFIILGATFVGGGLILESIIPAVVFISIGFIYSGKGAWLIIDTEASTGNLS